MDNCICDFSNAVDIDNRQKETEIPIADGHRNLFQDKLIIRQLEDRFLP